MSTPSPGSAGPACRACGEAAVVNWTRRLTEDELAALVEQEQQNRDQLTALAPPEQPPVFGPMPTLANSTQIVHACATHSISLDLATLVHQCTCTAPNDATLPGCDCTPESLPESEPDSQVVAALSLPGHWQPTV